MSDPIKVFKAKMIRTMARNTPEATHVAVRDGRILAVGSEADCATWGDIVVDTRFEDKVLMPGFVEAHGHAMEGTVWNDLFLGYFKRTAPDGSIEGGLKDIEAVVARLQAHEATMTDPDAPLIAWGFDPIYFDGARMSREHLDRVSTTRPILVTHASFHLINVNTLVLERADMLGQTNVEGILRDADGQITGELQEMAAMSMAARAVGATGALRGIDAANLRTFGKAAVNAGVTTSADLHQSMTDEVVAAYQTATAEADFPVRMVPALGAIQWSVKDGIERALALKKQGNDKLHLGLVKIMTDGSIQGFTGRLKWPGYHNGAPNGLWNLPPASLKEMVKAYSAAGLQMHLHVNGDQASEFIIDVLTEALTEHPFPDHRHTLQHCQMADAAQFAKMKALGISANLFANHIFYWGEQHYALTMGPDRARRMDACGTALAHGVQMSIHSDVPVTPLNPLFTAWCAANRITSAGRVLGPQECIPVEEALKAVTSGAAYQLKLDHLVGTIEVGKFADFAVLDSDPLSVDAIDLRKVKVLGTVLGGEWQPSNVPADQGYAPDVMLPDVLELA
ncbi:amidohydrolase [Pseudooceanicola sediminis]|uniref:Amidohydrolase n=1 Tax=Pseudooceanicola sediminis TaxID=2211117 RepID=A0A399J7A3_9RHOB|nr:amidohydrolase [Pseudooceanicola sediminis]KAA2315377.1 amidohydrolase [Puniceibacterium sp. HSS470]RII40417.1 amidohydrolase [Pseudooceanicola sediminis]|tara:strand:- start:5823 stop:7520 length:1698 start_codon:yes stop_codon:yes gene_type:complete